MKQWKRKLWKTCNGVLATLLAWLGFSCLDENGNEPIVCEYGVPTAAYSLKGHVVDSQGNAVADMPVVISDGTFPYNYLIGDTVKTDANGEFIWENKRVEPRDFQTIQWKIVDTCRIYQDTTGITVFDPESAEGADGWFIGRLSAEETIRLRDYQESHSEPYLQYRIYGRITNSINRGMPLVFLSARKANGQEPKEFFDISNWNGEYSFTYEKAPGEGDSLVVYTSPVTSAETGWSQDIPEDSVVIRFDGVPLTEGSGLLKGKGSIEQNISYSYEAYPY